MKADSAKIVIYKLVHTNILNCMRTQQKTMVEELVNQLLEENTLKQVASILEATEAFIKVRRIVISKMRHLADELDKHQFNGNIAKLVGSGTGVAAGIIAGSLLLAIPTGRLIGASVASGIALAGTATKVGTRLTIIIRNYVCIQK